MSSPETSKFVRTNVQRSATKSKPKVFLQGIKDFETNPYIPTLNPGAVGEIVLLAAPPCTSLHLPAPPSPPCTSMNLPKPPWFFKHVNSLLSSHPLLHLALDLSLLLTLPSPPLTHLPLPSPPHPLLLLPMSSLPYSPPSLTTIPSFHESEKITLVAPAGFE